MVQEHTGRHQCLPRVNAAEAEVPSCPGHTSDRPLLGLDPELSEPDIGGGGLGSVKSGWRRDG
jgi:hypothetical protein